MQLLEHYHWPLAGWPLALQARPVPRSRCEKALGLFAGRNASYAILAQLRATPLRHPPSSEYHEPATPCISARWATPTGVRWGMGVLLLLTRQQLLSVLTQRASFRMNLQGTVNLACTVQVTEVASHGLKLLKSVKSALDFPRCSSRKNPTGQLARETRKTLLTSACAVLCVLAHQLICQPLQ